MFRKLPSVWRNRQAFVAHFIPFKFGKFNVCLSVNSLSDDTHHDQLDHALFKKSVRGDKAVLDPIRRPSNANKDVDKSIKNATCSKQILKLIQQNVSNIENAFIYGKAMQKCGKLRDFTASYDIMKLLIQSNLPSNGAVEFNIFFNSMAQSDISNALHLCLKYFDIMLKRSIHPTEITFSAILKAFRTRPNYHEALKFWNLMRNKYNIKPSNTVYNEMLLICARTHQTETAINIFNEYYQRVKNKEFKSLHLPVLSSYLHVFSRIGDIDRIHIAINLIKTHGFEIDIVATCDIMTGYYRAREYKKSLEQYQIWVDSGKNPNLAMLRMKCIALTGVICSGYSFGEKVEYFNKLKYSIHEETELYGLKINTMIANTYLDGAIWLYG
eukprot:43220_1